MKPWLLNWRQAAPILGLWVIIVVSLPLTIRWFYGGTQKYRGFHRAGALELRYPILWRIGSAALIALPIICLVLLLGRLKGTGGAFWLMVCFALFALGTLVSLGIISNIRLWT